MSSDKQLHYSDRTFDIVPHTITPRNLHLERGMFNQASGIEFKNPEKRKTIKKTMTNPEINHYKNPYAISQSDFYESGLNTRKIDKRNRTNIYNERLNHKSKYINQMQQSNNKYLDRFFQPMDQKNPQSQKFKTSKAADQVSFKEYMEFKQKMAQHDGTPKY